jgi:hypothetical protein
VRLGWNPLIMCLRRVDGLRRARVGRLRSCVLPGRGESPARDIQDKGRASWRGRALRASRPASGLFQRGTGRRLGQTERASLLLVDRSARERFHKITLTRAFRHSGGHAGPFGRVTSYIGCLVTSVVWVAVNTRMVTLAGVKSGKDTGQLPVAEVQVVLLVDPSGAVTRTVTGV